MKIIIKIGLVCVLVIQDQENLHSKYFLIEIFALNKEKFTNIELDLFIHNTNTDV